MHTRNCKAGVRGASALTTARWALRASCLVGPVVALGQPATPLRLDPVEVVGTAPLPELGVPISRVPSNVQVLKSRDVDGHRAADLSQALNLNAGSVNINDTSGSPFQPDINFRGFTASPALGTPQGLSVFVDGVRVNEVFGDTVNWDLIPLSAISSVTVVPGSNPVFGLNTLGGALSVTTKAGLSDPGTLLQLSGGSFGRQTADFSSGGQSGSLDYFVTAHSLHESGWGTHNPGRLGQLFGKMGLRNGADQAELSLTLADNRLEGNQTLPVSFMDDVRQAYSWPDYQTNRLIFVNLKLQRDVSKTLQLLGSLSYRQLDTYVQNSNVNNNFDVTRDASPGNQPTGNAINRIEQRRPGGSLQLVSTQDLVGHENHLVIGVNHDRGATGFEQSSQESGSSRDTSSDSPISLNTSLHATTTASGLYATDNFGISDALFLTLSGRYDRARIELKDRLGEALNGDHAFHRLNPAIGLAYNPQPNWTTYASYNEGMRVPTAVELTCADPNAPCSLPNAFSSDPALSPVTSKTFEVGARGRWDSGLRANAAVFRTELNDDIQFISSGGGATSAGYFRNVGRTRRQGLEVGAEAVGHRLSLSAHYSYILASFESPLVLNSPNNSTAAAISCVTCTEIQVQPGDRIPGIPRHLLKVRAEWAVDSQASVGLSLLAQSKQFTRGDENNQDVNGPVPGFSIVNLDARYAFDAGWEIFARVDNLFDRRYSTFGTLGQNVFTGATRSFDASGASWRNEQFQSVGIPRGIWVGVALRLGGPSQPSVAQ